jgi:hypothetical protein
MKCTDNCEQWMAKDVIGSDLVTYLDELSENMDK